MDTKLKKGKRLGVVISILLVFLLTSLLFAASFPIYEYAAQKERNIYDQENFPQALYNYSYLLSWQLQRQADTSLTPAQVFFFEAMEELEIFEAERAARGDAEFSGTYEEARRGEELFLLYNSANLFFEELQDDFNRYFNTYHFLALDAGSGAVLQGEENGSAQQAALLKRLAGSDVDKALQQELEQVYRYYAVFSFDEDGNFSASYVYGASAHASDTPNIDEEFVERSILSRTSGTEFTNEMMGSMHTIKNQSFVYAIPRALGATDPYESFVQMYRVADFRDSGFALLYLFALAAALLAGCILALSKRLELSRFRLARQPLECSVLVLLFALSLEEILPDIVYETIKGTLITLPAAWGISADAISLMGYALVSLFLAALLGAVYMQGLSLMQLKIAGPRAYFRKSLLIRLGCAIGRGGKRLVRWAGAIDFAEKGNKTILKVVCINFVVVSLLCSAWFFGIVGVILYSVGLFFILRKYDVEYKQKYAVLLKAAQEMAAGNLDVSMEEDVGPFEPIKEQLCRVKEGFGRAVEAETKSQNMKTELITNVSHDLKTPLTAIITYVDLLKKEDVTEEERQSYLQTLDSKSQRLKSLIEDLFEVSKASSKNATLHVADIDLPELIRQVELENRSALDAVGIEFRYHVPEEKLVLQLDSEKTSRIFENLIINVAKYAMPQTRAYVDVQLQAHICRVEIKNVSRQELDFDAESVTERFVRGDRSRNTEGAGLGLAIVKSFVELQSGSFEIQTDGDMFKAVVLFPEGGAQTT